MISDERSGFYAKVILDSIAPCGKRLTSVECKYWRSIHSELLTHRDRARNSASSRAIPWKRLGKDGKPIKNCMYAMISNEPFIPVFIGGEQKGMQSGGELEGQDREDTIQDIMDMRDYCLAKCDRMASRGVHKSIVNRYTEPWMYITTLYTATEWRNFFRLRVHPKAEKHFNLLAGMIKEAINESIPLHLTEGEWHRPYIRSEDHNADTYSLRIDLRKESDVPRWAQMLNHISAARCARLSYLTHDGKRDLSEDLRLFNDLINPKKDDGTPDDALHASALEHVAEAQSTLLRSGPFIGWKQLRKEFPNENLEG